MDPGRHVLGTPPLTSISGISIVETISVLAQSHRKRSLKWSKPRNKTRRQRRSWRILVILRVSCAGHTAALELPAGLFEVVLKLQCGERGHKAFGSRQCR